MAFWVFLTNFSMFEVKKILVRALCKAKYGRTKSHRYYKSTFHEKIDPMKFGLCTPKPPLMAHCVLFPPYQMALF